MTTEEVFEENTAFWFPVNEADGVSSVTYHKVTVPKGTPKKEAQAAINEFLEYLGYDAKLVINSLDFHELQD